MPPPDPEPDSDLVLRQAAPDDLATIGAVLTRTRAAAYPAMPHGVRAIPAVLRWVAGWDLSSLDATHEIWVAEIGGEVLGYARFTDTWLDDLYVEPTAQRGGVGSALLDLVKARRPDGLSLWVFESNLPARAFYERQGLVEVLRTDGADNEERQPDIQLRW